MKKKKKDFLAGNADTGSSLPDCKVHPVKAGAMRSVILMGMALAVITLAVYWQVGDHEFLSYDDDKYITKNTHVSTGITGSNIIWAFTSVEVYNWHPVTWMSHQADAQLYGMNPRGHHHTNVVIHAITTLLLLFLLFRLTGSLWRSSFVAALFALHPLHVESVAWAAERKDVLSAFFWFLTLLFYTEYVAKRRALPYLLSLFSFILGLMSKPMLVTLPLVMLLMDFWPLSRCGFNKLPSDESRPSVMTVWTEKIPFFVCSLLSSAVTIYAQQKGGAVPTLDAVPLVLRLENSLTAYGRYIIQLFWPHDMAVLYPFPTSIPLWQVVCSLLVVLIVSAATIRVRRRHPYLAVGWFWFILTLLPVIGVIQVGVQSMADRYAYIPLTGLFIMAAWGVPALARDLPYRHYTLAPLAAVVIIASAAVAWRQIGYWQNNISLYEHTLNVTSGNYVIHNNLGLALADTGDLDAAVKEYQAALKMNPHYAEAHNNLAVVLADKGYPDAAVKEYQAAVKINPRYAEAHNNLGTELARRGDLDGAIEEYQTALRLRPDYAEAHNNRGAALASKGDLDAAIRDYQAALKIDPDFPEAHNNMGNALTGKGDLDAAIREYQAALKVRPDFSEAHRNLGAALAGKGDLDAAIKEYRAALKVRPDFSEAHRNLGAALAGKGDLDAAIEEYRIALKINPNSAEAHNDLGVALARRGDLDAAIKECRAALKIRPDFSEAHHNLGAALAGKGDLDAAIKEYRMALEVRPNNFEAHNNLGAALANKGNLDAAIKEYRAALKIRPDFSEAHHNLGAALAGKGDLDAAIKEYQMALKINPNYAEAHNNLGVALARRGDPDAAIRECQAALKIRPDFAEAQNNLRLFLEKKKRRDKARD